MGTRAMAFHRALPRQPYLPATRRHGRAFRERALLAGLISQLRAQRGTHPGSVRGLHDDSALIASDRRAATPSAAARRPAAGGCRGWRRPRRSRRLSGPCLAPQRSANAQGSAGDVSRAPLVRELSALGECRRRGRDRGSTHLIPFVAGHEIVRHRRRKPTLIRMTPDLPCDRMTGAVERPCAPQPIDHYREAVREWTVTYRGLPVFRYRRRGLTRGADCGVERRGGVLNGAQRAK